MDALKNKSLQRKFLRNAQIIMSLSIPDKAKVNVTLYAESLLVLDLLKNASLFYRLGSFSRRTVRLLTRQSWLKTELPPAAVNLLTKMNGHQTRRNLTS